MSRLPIAAPSVENLLPRQGAARRTPASIARLQTAATASRRADRLHAARVLLQDFTGVAGGVDCGDARRNAADRRSQSINPLQTRELVIDHSVQVRRGRHPGRFLLNDDRGWSATARLRLPALGAGRRSHCAVVRGQGIGHRSTSSTRRGGDERERERRRGAYPDTSSARIHTTMINGLGVHGWGVGGIEAEAPCSAADQHAGQKVVGFRLTKAARGAPPQTVLRVPS